MINKEWLVDPALAAAADALDDLESIRIANENRLRQLTDTRIDKDGVVRGFGLAEDHQSVLAITAVVQGLKKLEKQATKDLEKAMKKNPLFPWVEAQHGMGKKQTARLLRASGDPAWHFAKDRPRALPELWSYCGYSTTKYSPNGDQDQKSFDDQGRDVFVAVRRQRGQRASWSTDAKSRAFLIAEKMLQLGNREVYDKRRSETQDRLHMAPCVRCGPSGKPAQPGSPWAAGHQHADALRYVAKTVVLKGLWKEARRLHGIPDEVDQEPA